MTVITPDMINLPSQKKTRTKKTFGLDDSNTMRFTHNMGDSSFIGQSARDYIMQTFVGRPTDGLILRVKATGSRLSSRQSNAGLIPGNLTIVLSTKHPLYEDARFILKDINSRLPQVTYVSEHISSSQLENMDIPVTPKDPNPYVRLKTKTKLDPRFDEVKSLVVTFSKPMSKDAFIETVLRGLNTDPSVNEGSPGMMHAAVMRPVYTQQQVNTARSELQSAVSEQPRGLEISFSGLSPFVISAVDSLIHSLGHHNELNHVMFTHDVKDDVFDVFLATDVIKPQPQQKLPVFQKDLDFVIRIPKSKVHLISGSSAGLLEEVEKAIRRNYRQLKRQGQPIKHINAPIRDTSFRNDPRSQAGIRSNSAIRNLTPSMRARQHYASDATFESELQNLKSKAIMPNETTLVFPAGSFNPHMFYLMMEIYEGANKGQDSASVGFEKFEALPTRDTMPIKIEEDPKSSVATDMVESSVASTDGADSDKGMSPWVIGGISVGVLALIYGAYRFGRNR